METSRYQKIGEVNGRWKADIIESFLLSQGIQVQLIQDVTTHYVYKSAHDLVLIFVPHEQVVLSRELLNSFEEFQLDVD